MISFGKFPHLFAVAALILGLLVSSHSSSQDAPPSSVAAPTQSTGGTPSALSAPPSSIPSITNVPRAGTGEPNAAAREALISKEAPKPTQPPLSGAAISPGERNDFQDFIAQTTGRVLPLFGYDLFVDAPSTFAPVERIPVPNDYVIGPGDEIMIRAWGQLDIDYHAVVDRNGTISIPQVGVVNVTGLRYQDLSSYLKTAIGRVFRNFELTATLGALRSIQVFVVGAAKRPGSYTVSSLSTLVNTLFVSGGPSSKGSMRRIQLKRNDKVVTEFDIYDLLVKGDKSRDAKLLPGDVIYIPPVGELVAISGSVNNSAIYELKGKSTVEELITLAGGLTTTAAGQKVTLERISNRTVRTVQEFPLDRVGLSAQITDGDLVQVFALSPRFENVVSLRGNVAAPARYPWREGLRVRDVIPTKDALIVADYWVKRNLAIRSGVRDQSQLRNDVKRVLPEINWDYAVVERLQPDLTTALIPFNLGKVVLSGDEEQNVLLRPGDVITIFSQEDIQVPVARRTQYVRLEGEVRYSGLYQIEAGETLRQVLARVGGLTPNAYLFGAEFTRERTRLEQQKRLDEAIERLSQDIERGSAQKARNATSAEEVASIKVQAESQRGLLERLRTLKSTGRIVLEVQPEASSLKDLPDLALEDNDRLLIPSRPSTVNVLGSVYNQTAFIYRPDKRLSDYLAQAGGPTKNADERSIYVVRADGSVASKRQSNWIFGRFSGERLMPNDTVVVPEDTERISWLKELRDISQIFYQFGLAAAAIKVLRSD